MEIFILILGAIALFTIAFVYAPLVWGLVTLQFWTWFILPIFPELPVLEYWQAVGVFFFISLFRATTIDTLKEEFKKDKSSIFILALLTPWFVLLVGYIFNLIIN